MHYSYGEELERFCLGCFFLSTRTEPQIATQGTFLRHLQKMAQVVSKRNEVFSRIHDVTHFEKGPHYDPTVYVRFHARYSKFTALTKI